MDLPPEDSSPQPAEGNVLSFEAFRNIRQAEKDEFQYELTIAHMDKLELLEEMVRFQEERSKVGKLTLPMMLRGRHLFKALEMSAETRELQILTKAYRRHLDYEISVYKRTANELSDQEAEELG